jgi:DNA (cytosine-5)-methyltransferase 1
MKLKEKISINEFDGKRFQIRLVEPNLSNHKKAIITHYLHNIDTGVSKHFKKEAEKAIKEYVTYKNEEDNLSLVTEDALQRLLFEVNDVPFPTPKKHTFKFIDLFAGIGGFRIAMQNLGGKCVFTSEWDKEAQRTYRANFGEVPS